MLEQLCILDVRNLRLNFNQSFVVSGVNVTSDILLMCAITKTVSMHCIQKDLYLQDT